MTVNYQVAIDCADPHRLARFWADALGWEVERHADQIRRLLEAGHATDGDVMTYDGELVWRIAAAIRDPAAPVDERGAPVRSRVLFQVVPEAKTVKNRVHLDIHTAGADRDVEVARIEGLGGKRLWEGAQGPHTWVTMADPEGNEFCVS